MNTDDAARDESDRILFAISKAAHDACKERRQYLTSLRTVDTASFRLSANSAGSVAPSPSTEPAHWSVYPRRLLDAEQSGLDNSPSGRGVTQFAKDNARILHSPSFRRLQGKTQLIPSGENEGFFRTRLTHSLEVAEVAMRIASRLNDKYSDYFKTYPLSRTIVACASLLHDIGHPPFGHSGEQALNECMDDFGGFESNAQTLRIATKLENRLGRGGSLIQANQEGPRGLNLTIGTLASVIKYDNRSEGPVHKGDTVHVNKGYYPTEEPTVKAVRNALGLTDSERLYTIECQIMDIADDITYSAYDLEDTLEAGIVSPFDLMSLDDAMLLQITADVNEHIAKRLNGVTVSPESVLYRLADVFGTLILYGEKEHPYDFTRRCDRLAFVGRTYAESLMHAKNPLVRRQYLETLIERNIAALTISWDDSSLCLSRLEVEPEQLVTIEAIKAFNFRQVISSRRLQLYHHRCRKIITDIFEALAGDQEGRLLSEQQRESLQHCAGDESQRMRLIADIISSLTDAEATRFYDQLHSSRNAPFMAYTR